MDSARRKFSYTPLLAALTFAAAPLFVSGPAQAVDADAAQTLAKQSKCLTCHAIDKKKKAPSYQEIAAKYKGKPDAEAKLIKHVTTGPKVKFEDGHEEDHATVKSKNQDEIKNLVDWILSL
jgi:cytochrome c